jgi:hypothetical protein
MTNGCVNIGSVVASTGSAPTPDTGFHPGGLGTSQATSSRSFAVTGKRLVAIRNYDGSTLFESPDLTSRTLDNFANPVILTVDCMPLPDCGTSTKITNFVAGDDGFLYKVVYDTMTSMLTTTSINLQRPGCSGDKLKGTPAVQLNRYSNGPVGTANTFQWSMGNTTDDLVIVGTYYPDQGGTCPGGANRVYGIRSTDLSIRWTYNSTGSQTLNEVTEACPVEYYSGSPPAGTNNNMVVCGFNKTAATNGLVALNTAILPASNAGAARWAVDTGGAVIVRPVIATINGRRAVYVGTADAYLHAYSPVNGSAFWTGGIPAVQNGIAQNLWAEFRGGLLSNRIFVLANDGTFRRFVDNGTSGAEEGSGLTADNTGVAKYTSMVVAAPYGIDALYLGRNDGQVQQISSSYTQQEKQRVGGPTAIVFDPALDLDGSNNVKHLVVTAGSSGAVSGKIARIALPWCALASGSGGAGCTAGNASCNGYQNADPVHAREYEACRPRTCDQDSCQPGVVAPDGTGCDDGASCSYSFPVSAGCPTNKCVGGGNNGGNCSSTHDAACPGGFCFYNRCVGGPNANVACTTNAQCVGSGTNGLCKIQMVGSTKTSLCQSGAEVGNYCTLRCSGGALDGTPCVDNNNCFDSDQCVGGSNPGTFCTYPTGPECLGGGTCQHIGVCNDNNGAGIVSTDCPPAGRCMVWKADATNTFCEATMDNPACSTPADCPSTKYCALDPKNLVHPNSVCYDNTNPFPGSDPTDDCGCPGTNLGTCLVYDSCIGGVCVRTHQAGATPPNPTQTCSFGGSSGLQYLYGPMGCNGGAQGAGGADIKSPTAGCTDDGQCFGGKCVAGKCVGSCNNFCKNGRCTSLNYSLCSCESAGDRACAPGMTCCGAQGLCGRFGDPCNPAHDPVNGGMSSDCCSGNCQGSKCDQPAVTCKRAGIKCGAGTECCSGTCASGICSLAAPGQNCFDLNTSPIHCGRCDNNCGLQYCVNGVCQQVPATSPSPCNDMPNQGQVITAGASGGDSISYEHTNLNGTLGSQMCGAWVTRAVSASSGQLVRAGAGAPTVYNAPTSQPLNGVAPACYGDSATNFTCTVNDVVMTTYPALANAPLPRWTSGAINNDGVAPSANPVTSGGSLFKVSVYNNGPVGPAYDWKSYNGTPATRIAYWANWNTNGDIKKITGASPTTWTVANAAIPTPPPANDRVTAIAFGRRDYSWKSTTNGSKLTQKTNTLYFANSTSLNVVNIDTAPTNYMLNPNDPVQLIVDLAAVCDSASCTPRCDGGSKNGYYCVTTVVDPNTEITSAGCTTAKGSCSAGSFCKGAHPKSCTTLSDCHGCGPEKITGIQSLAPHPSKDVVYAVVKGSTGTFIVEVNPKGHSARHILEAQDELSKSDPACPNGNGDNEMSCSGCTGNGYTCAPSTIVSGDAKITFDPLGNLVWVELGDTLGSGFQDAQFYTVTTK